MGGRGADGPGVGRGRGCGVVAGHAQASLERGTRGAGGGPGGTQAGSLCHRERAGGGPGGWDGGRVYHASRVTRHASRRGRGRGGQGGVWGGGRSDHASRVTRQRERERSRVGGGPLGAGAPPGTDRNRRKWGERAGVPPFFFKKGGVAGSRRTYGEAARSKDGRWADGDERTAQCSSPAARGFAPGVSGPRLGGRRAG